MADLFYLGIPFLFIFILFIILLPLVVLVDILRSEFRDNNKIIWVFVVIFFPIIGSILYFIIGRGQKIRRRRPFEPPDRYRID